MSSTICRRFVNTLMNVKVQIYNILYDDYISLNRFDRLIARNLSVQIESDLHLKSKEETLKWLNNLTNFKILDAIFIVNQVL